MLTRSQNIIKWVSFILSYVFIFSSLFLTLLLLEFDFVIFSFLFHSLFSLSLFLFGIAFLVICEHFFRKEILYKISLVNDELNKIKKD